MAGKESGATLGWWRQRHRTRVGGRRGLEIPHQCRARNHEARHGEYPRVTARLKALGYTLAHAPHELPGPKARRQITQLEKIAGILPLSVRSMKWWALLIGRASIRGLAPRTNSVTPDALVVFPIQDALDECESGWREVGDPAIVIAPDDLRKSDTSAGPPYEIAIPDLNADGKLLNERHDLYFVDYLRTAFRFGGFSGSDGIDPLPQEL